MATTETRTGFRLPWSSDRSQEDPAGTDAGDGAPDPAAPTAKPSVAWPENDFESRGGFTANKPRPTDLPVQAEEATTPVIADAPAPAPRKPTKLMVDLAAAIRATTEAARDQRLSQIETDAASIVEVIRAQNSEGAAVLRRRSDDDVAAVREWAKAEIARIKEESEARIADRKHLLEREVSNHAEAIEDRVSEVQTAVTGYRQAMAAYFAQLEVEDDPARLATMAEAMPDPPSLEALAELEGLPFADIATQAASDGSAGNDEGTPSGSAEPVATAAAPAQSQASADDVPRWAAGETPDGFPEATEGGDPVDRGAIMAALEAAAEAVVAAEAAAESADQAEAAADAAETAVELLAGRSGHEDESEPEAQAALNARVDAGGFETESYTDRLASLLPGHMDGGADGEPRTTQVVVTGLVSVASIASFKRHLGRLAGVTGVAVASGPDGEFIFNVSHRPDVSFRDAVPTMPGFAARVTATGDGVVSVTAHDPEAEG